MYRIVRYIFLMLCISVATLAQTKVQQKLPEKTRILFVLDGSGSMNAVWEKEQSRMDAAKRILTRLVDSLRVNPNLELALRIYGHRFTRQANNCQDSHLEVPFAPKNHNAIVSKIKDVRPKGVTPITFSLLQASKDFPSQAGYRNILILITDGIESCGGDPCEVSLELQRKGVLLRPFIIGLGVEGGKVLDCVGKYIDSENASAFNRILNQSIETTFAKTTVSVELLDGAGKPTETNVDISFLNSATKTSAYEFVHFRDKLGRPDSVQIDPVLPYDMVVNTVPPVIRRNIQIENGKHNVVVVSAPQGNLIVRPEARGNAFSVMVREKGKSAILNPQRSGETCRYLEGEYEVETLTLPRRIFAIAIEADKTKTITLPSTGLVNINTISPGYGSIFEVTEKGGSQWVCNLDESLSQHAYNLLPGTYKIAFRVKNAGGSKYTSVKTFDLKSGQTVSINMFN
ncbi:MAG: vWA domain-containing protein [Bacteroidota bacterium]